ncbi:MAG: HNH endonuclease [Nitrospinae bacterium]|nr:HNH endonuclease [Nitrospinota bacterium]
MSAYVPVALRRDVRARFGNRCAYCRTAESLSVAIYEIEHIIPQGAGGETVLENLCLACPTCNRYKAQRRTAIAPLIGQPAPLFHPQQQPWEDHFTWSADATEIIGLTPTGQATIEALRMNRPPLLRLRRMWVKMGEHPSQTA